MKFTLTLLLTVFLALGFALPAAQAQERTITGTVTDDQGEPLVGVNITIAGTTTGTVSDLDGNYSLTVPEGARLVFSYTGYTSQEVAVLGGQTVINVELAPGVNLNEVVVTALGISREKKALGYAVQEVGGEELLSTREPNLVNALQGRVAGVQITSSGGGPGQSARIVIRGVNSLDPTANNQPLFVVDGVLIDNSTLTVGGSSARNFSNRVGDLNPDDIETVSVLKGGAATALYGVRASNGAVIITTKKGKAGKLAVDFNSTFGVEEVNKFPETQRVYTQGFGGVYDPNSFWPSWGPTTEEARQIDPTHPEVIFNNYENGYQQGQQWRNTLSFSGGNEQANFRASLSRLDHEGVLPFSNYQNTSVRLNGEFRASEKFSFGGGVNYINSGGDRVNADRFNESSTYWAPRVDVTDYEFEDGTMKGYRNDGRVGNNPIYGAKTNKLTDDVDRFIYNLNFNYRPWQWMSLNYRIGLDQYTDSRFYRAPAPSGIENENVHEDNGLGFVEETRIRNRDLTSTLSAAFNFNITDKLDATLLVGNDIYDKDYNRVGIRGEELDIWNLYTINNTKVIRPPSSYLENYRIVGVYGDLTMGYDNTLFLTITGRNDWSSALPKESRSFFYPSVSLGWVFSESFDLPTWWTFGKLRGSYAGIGKDTQPYRTNSTYEQAAGFPINGVSGWTRSNQKGAPDLEPEQTNTIEVGADLRFFQNRLGIDFTWYKANSKKQIIPVPASSATGFTSFILNAGEIENKGIELVLNATPVQSRDFSWDITFNVTTNQNEVLSIKEGIEEIFLGSHFGYAGATASLRLITGQPYGNIYGQSYARYYENPDDDDGLTIDESRPMLIGANGFPVIDRTQRILGNSTPRWFGSVINSFSWKGINLSFMFDTRQGVDKYNQMDNFFSAFGIAPYTLNRNETVVFEGVTASGEPNTKEVWLGQGIGPDGVNYGAGYYRNTYRASTENSVEDASWWRLRNLSLGYSLPQSVLSGTPLSRANITFTGFNLWLDTPYSGFDPEGNRGNDNGDDGLAGFTYPGVRRYSVTLNLSF